MEDSKRARLEIYRKALADYLLTKEKPELSDKFYTNAGFCRYFTFMTKVKLEMLPELMKQRPQTDAMYQIFWFPIGNKEERIKCLEEAIKLIS